MYKETITVKRTNRDGSVTEYTQERWVNTEEEARMKQLRREEAYREEQRIEREREALKYYNALHPIRMCDILDSYEEYLRNVSDFRY